MNKLILYEKYIVFKEFCVWLIVDFGNVLVFWYVVVYYILNCIVKMKIKRNIFNNYNV